MLPWLVVLYLSWDPSRTKLTSFLIPLLPTQNHDQPEKKAWIRRESFAAIGVFQIQILAGDAQNPFHSFSFDLALNVR